MVGSVASILEAFRGRVRSFTRQHFKLGPIVRVIIHQELFYFSQEVLVEVFDGDHIGMRVAGLCDSQQSVVTHCLSLFGLLSFYDADQT